MTGDVDSGAIVSVPFEDAPTYPVTRPRPDTASSYAGGFQRKLPLREPKAMLAVLRWGCPLGWRLVKNRFNS